MIWEGCERDSKLESPGIKADLMGLDKRNGKQSKTQRGKLKYEISTIAFELIVPFYFARAKRGLNGIGFTQCLSAGWIPNELLAAGLWVPVDEGQ